MAWVVKRPKIYFKMLNNPSLLKGTLSLLYKYAHTFVIRFEKSIQISLIIDIANNSVGSSERRDSTNCYTFQHNSILKLSHTNRPDRQETVSVEPQIN